MKYLRFLIVVLVIVLVGIGAFYAYLVLNTSKSGKTLNTETARPFPIVQEVSNSSPVTKTQDYTSADSTASGGILKIQGHFQVVDLGEKVINGITYTYVIGILDDNRNLSRIWLTANEYEEISKVLSAGTIFQGYPVILTLSQNAVSLEKVLP